MTRCESITTRVCYSISSVSGYFILSDAVPWFEPQNIGVYMYHGVTREIWRRERGETAGVRELPACARPAFSPHTSPYFSLERYE